MVRLIGLTSHEQTFDVPGDCFPEALRLVKTSPCTINRRFVSRVRIEHEESATSFGFPYCLQNLAVDTNEAERGHIPVVQPKFSHDAYVSNVSSFFTRESFLPHERTGEQSVFVVSRVCNKTQPPIVAVSEEVPNPPLRCACVEEVESCTHSIFCERTGIVFVSPARNFKGCLGHDLCPYVCRF